MAERTNKPKEERSFSEFLKEAPAASEALGDDISLTGVVMRSDKEGMFVLATADGQTLELNANDVKSYDVVQETGPQKMVQINLSSRALNAATGATIGGAATRTLVFDTRKELLKDPIIDVTRKELVKDPLTDPWTWVEQQGTIQEQIDPTGGLGVDPALEAGGANLTPFIMATPHHASQAAVGMQAGAGAVAGAALTLKELNFDHTRKELIKDPLFDTRKELIKDPITDPITWVENVGTIQETVFDPGLGNVINPVAGGGVPGQFAQQPQVGPEAGAAAATAVPANAAFKSIIADRFTRKEIIYDTIKEIAKDPIYDTRKEVFETIVEGGGTIQEGQGGYDPGGIWQLPGMMF